MESLSATDIAPRARCSQPKPLLIRLIATTFNRFPTVEDYVGWFTDAGLTNIQTRFISNPWNAQQYALAICGTKAVGTAQPARALPEPASAGSRCEPTVHRLCTTTAGGSCV